MDTCTHGGGAQAGVCLLASQSIPIEGTTRAGASHWTPNRIRANALLLCRKLYKQQARTRTHVPYLDLRIAGVGVGVVLMVEGESA